jgi:anaerobic dimethyl sulfoxide reductase subunit B
VTRRPRVECEFEENDMEPLIIFDSRKCIACRSCEIACQLENDAPPGVRLRHVATHTSGKYSKSYPRSISTACFHCGDPSCVSACPAGALFKRTDGVVVHSRNKCIGCGYCIHACPFQVPQFSPAQSTMRKCSFCTQRIDAGKMPACASKCTTGALAFFPNSAKAPLVSAYGRKERLQMIYALEGDPKEYRLPQPAPANTVTAFQGWKWLAGLIPGGIVLGWLMKAAEDREKGNA